MQFRVFKIPCRGDLDLEDSFNCFLRSHRIVSVSKELAKLPEGMAWCFCVEYLDLETRTSDSSLKKSKDRIDYKDVLSEEEFVLFVQLRDLRKELSLRDAVPLYTIFTNDQLAKMVQGDCNTVSDLRKIPGLGEAKIQKYADEFLRILSSSPQTEKRTSHEADQSTDKTNN